MDRAPRILAIDTGGTMTDTFFIDREGEFVVGKAQTTPENESVGFMHSCVDALSYWDVAVEEGFPALVTAIYSGTIMLNRLLERKGQKVGLIVTKGCEDYFRLERASQTYLGYSYSDRLHVCTHQHNPPLVPFHLIRGVAERMDVVGDEAIPLNEEEARRAVEELLDKGVDCICVSFLFCYRNPTHELQMQDIAAEVIAERGTATPVFIASDCYSVRGDFPRVNTLVAEAFAAEPSRGQLRQIDGRIKESGGRLDLRVMASHGGSVSLETRELARTLVSGPIGGVVGAKWLSERLGIDNVVCTDIGGTSFDIAMITKGHYEIKPYPDMARMLLVLPLVEIDSVGAGTGSYIRVNPTSGRVEIGPDSAGYRIGVSWPEGGVETPTITDCDLVLGLLDPDYFLGGDMVLDKDRALAAIEERVARPLGIDVYEAAHGILELFESNLKNEVRARILAKGYSPPNYTLLSYGGGGPLHVGGYTEGMDFDGVLVPTWAAGFSAFGCSCADFEYSFNVSVDLPIAPDIGPDEKEAVVELANAQCSYLREKITGEFEKSGVAEEDILFRIHFRIQYMGQLRDLEVKTDFEWLEDATSMDEVIAAFEELYAKVYARSARSPELGYLITQIILSGKGEVEKPVLPSEKPGGVRPPEEALKGSRQVYWRGAWTEAPVYEMGDLKAGNVLDGLAIVEDPATTFVIPPGASARLDEHRIFRMVWA